MYTRILVAVDGSPFSEQVIPYARAIAEATGAKLTLLRIAESGATAEAEEYLRALAAGSGAETRVITGRVTASVDILEEANAVPGTLVVVTSHGRGGVLVAVLGSVAREIVQASHNPVLVYRPDDEAGERASVRIATVLLPLDGTSRSESVTAQAAELARALGATLTVVQVLPKIDKMDRRLASHDVLDSSYVSSHAHDIERQYGVAVNWEVLHGDPVDALESYIDGRDDVLAVMATREQNAVKAAVLGSVTSGMVHRAGIPIIVQSPATVQNAPERLRAARS